MEEESKLDREPDKEKKDKKMTDTEEAAKQKVVAVEEEGTDAMDIIGTI